MIEPIGALSPISEAMAGTAAQGSITPVEIQQFETALREAGGVEMPTVSIQTAEPIQREMSLTQVISDAVDQIRTSNGDHIRRIQDLTVNTEDPTRVMEMRDLFSLQFELMQLSLQQDFTTKVADKLSQGAQTLFRNQ